MKKLITIVLLSVLAMPVFAQDYDFEPEERWTVKANAAYLPTVPILIDLFGGIFAGIAIGLNKDSNETLDFTTPPYISVEGLYSFNEDWSAGLSVGYCGTIFKTVDKDTREVHNRSTITLIPINVEGRLNYMNRPKCKLYGSLEAGIFLNLGNGSGCYDLGLFYYTGNTETEQDYGQAKDLFEKSCRLRDGNGCHVAGTIYYKGKGVDQDLRQAKYYYGKSCHLGDLEGCDMFNRLKDSMEG